MKNYLDEKLEETDAIKVYKALLRGDIKRFPNGFLKFPEGASNSRDCIRYLIEVVLDYDIEDLKENLSLKTFRANKLGGMLYSCFRDSPYEAINFVYPGALHEWELKVTPKSFLDKKENCIKALRWLIEEKLCLSDEELKKTLSYDLLIENSFGRMLKIHFNDSAYDAINALYPGKFREWEFRNVKNSFWSNKENGIEAGRWLLEEVLKYDDEALKKNLTVDLFRKNGLGSMLSICFNHSPYRLISALYPGKFQEWEFSNVPKRFWQDKENGVRAMNWLFKEVLKMDIEEIKENVSTSTFNKYGLDRMLRISFDNDIYKALDSIYPGEFKRGDLKRYRK